MRPPTDRENTLVLLREWKQHHDAVAKLLGSLEATIGLNYSGPLFETVWKLFDAYTATLAVEVSDFDGWLEWFILENYMGGKALQAGFDNKMRKISTLEDLQWLLAESQERSAK